MNVSLRIERPNCTTVRIGGVSLYFSYETIVGFRTSETGTVLSENIWSQTTGKHLNVHGCREDRIPHAEFEKKLEEVLSKQLPSC